MIFIVANNRQYSDGRLYFVEAPASFERWFRETLVPYIEEVEEQTHVPSIESPKVQQQLQAATVSHKKAAALYIQLLNDMSD